MNTFRKSFLIGLTVLSMGTGTLALAAHANEDHPASASAGRHEDHAGKFAERMAKHQARLHDKLKLTAAQEPAWKTLTAATTKGAMPARMDHAAIANMSAPERLEKWIAASKERITQQESHLADLKTFYAVLTPEQKKIFDDSVPGGQHGGHRAHRMMHPSK